MRAMLLTGLFTMLFFMSGCGYSLCDKCVCDGCNCAKTGICTCENCDCNCDHKQK